MTATSYAVMGMTCQHCVRAVTEELTRLKGVTEVNIEIVPGGASSVTVTSAEMLPRAAVSAALDEAGAYRLGTG